MNKTFWYTDGTASYPELNEDLQTDVAIIGGGLAGVMCAYELNNRGFKVCLLEADKICSGESGKSSAMVSVAHDIIYSRLIKKKGIETAKRYLKLQENGLKKIESIIKENNIECDYNNCNMKLYARTKKGVKQILKEQKAYQDLGYAVETTGQTKLPFTVKIALSIKGQGHLNPFKFVHGLCGIIAKKGVGVFEQTPVTGQPEDGRIKIKENTVTAKHFVIATHFPYLILPGFYFTKMYQHRSHNIVFSSGVKLYDIYESADDNGFEYRPAGNYIMCGGANIRTGKYKHKSQYKIVEESIKENFNATDENILSRFSAQDCMTFDMLPLVGKYSNFLDDLFVITGFNKWGFTNSAAAADIIADILSGKNVEDNIFDTKRLYFLSTPLKAAANAGELALNFANLIINADAKKIKRIKAGQGAVVRHKGRRLGVYKNAEGKICAVSAICPHMGCSLRWNKDELSWDCPCHGSRFDTEGKILSNPAIERAQKVSIDNGQDI